MSRQRKDGNKQVDNFNLKISINEYIKKQEGIGIIKAKQFIPDEYFIDYRTNKMRPVGEIAEELEKMYIEDYGREQSDNYRSMERIKAIYEYMWDYGILDEVMYYIADGVYGEAINKSGEGGIFKRTQELCNKINPENTEEVLMVDAFFSNSMTKHVEAVMDTYYEDKKYIEGMYADFIEKKMHKNVDFRINEFGQLNNDDLNEFVLEWCKSKGKEYNQNLVDELSAYIKLNMIKKYMYQMKDEALSSLCQEYPEHIKYIDKPDKSSKKSKLYIFLPEYAVPIVLHTNMSKMDFRKMGIQRATYTEKCVPATCIPLKLNPQEMNKFDEALKDEGIVSIPRERNAEKEVQVEQDEQGAQITEQNEELPKKQNPQVHESDINSLDVEIESLRAEYDVLIQREQIKQDEKKKLEEATEEIIKDKQSKKSKVAKIKIFLKPKNKELLLALGMEEKVQQLERQLEEIEHQLQKVEDDERKNEEQKSKTAEEMQDIQKRKEKIEKEMQEIMDRNDL